MVAVEWSRGLASFAGCGYRIWPLPRVRRMDLRCWVARELLTCLLVPKHNAWFVVSARVVFWHSPLSSVGAEVQKTFWFLVLQRGKSSFQSLFESFFRVREGERKRERKKEARKRKKQKREREKEKERKRETGRARKRKRDRQTEREKTRRTKGRREERREREEGRKGDRKEGRQ